MLNNLRQRAALRDESGFTLIELLVVLIIIGVLLAIAVPSYLGFKDRAEKRSAMADVRSAIPDAEAYFSDVGNYTNMGLTTGDAPDAGGLTGIDAGIKLDAAGPSGTDQYCLSKTVGKYTAWVVGPGGDVDVDPDGSGATPAC